MPIKDLRDWISRVEEIGELRRAKAVHWDLEMGAICDLYTEKVGRPALLFDEVPGYSKGFRVLANCLTSIPRIGLSMNLSSDISKVELINSIREYFKKGNLIPPKIVKDGAVLENVQRGSQVDLNLFPSPRWHEHDVERFIGTGCSVLIKDPDSDWVNLGCYRVAVHDEKTLGVMITAGKDGHILMEKYWKRGEPCPVVVLAGQDPLQLILASAAIPENVGELDVAGYIMGEPVQVIKGEYTGLPIPAGAEIAIEGEIKPNDLKDEGPFGEWTGYYAGGRRPSPVIRVNSVLYRNNPIILGCIPGIPPCDDGYFSSYLICARMLEELEQAGVPGVKGVWLHESGSKMMATVSIEQLYQGHAKQAGLIASQCRSIAYLNRIIVVVDDDIDPFDIDKVLWALCTRVDPRFDLEVLKNCWSSPLDPISYPEDLRLYNARMVFDACRPFHQKNTFPLPVYPSDELKRKILNKYPELFSNID